MSAEKSVVNEDSTELDYTHKSPAQSHLEQFETVGSNDELHFPKNDPISAQEVSKCNSEQIQHSFADQIDDRDEKAGKCHLECNDQTNRIS